LRRFAGVSEAKAEREPAAEILSESERILICGELSRQPKGAREAVILAPFV
jgi:hypothetical protein